MSSLENYLHDLRDTHATGENVKETSFYPSLSNLFNSVGAMLNPKVRVVINIKNRGAGLPDGGFFTAKQLKKIGGDESLREPSAFKGQQPERGVVEVKGAKEDVRVVAKSEQVRRYLNAYGQVLVTNLREFLLVTKDINNNLVLGESYTLAQNEKELWEKVRHPKEFAKEHEARFTEYLKRVMLSLAPLEDPKDLAWFLASYARDAKARIEKAELPSLQSVREAMEQALEIKFEGDKGETFFRSTLIQTLFYGVFSAWVLWSKSARVTNNRFDWRMAAWTLHVPVIRTLFEKVVTPTQVSELNLEEVLDWTAETLNRVRHTEFFTRFEEEHAVQYFYEPFLEAFDPELRKQLGVWYTPEEIVRYMVERVDRVLRTELDIENGLADERVYVLDPCCGTGAYLVEVLKRIKRTIDEQGGDALAANDLKLAAQRRIFGFEILPAPFVVAHLQLGLLLQREGSGLEKDERVGVYLTNALTGWEPPREPKKQLSFDFHTLQEERDAAEAIKRETPILVVIGNPPYNAKPKAGDIDILYSSAEKASPSLNTDIYKEKLNTPVNEGGWGIKKFNLDELYVRFFRLAERRIAENTGIGIVSFISNYSWTTEPSFVVLRQRLLESFDKFWIENMHGNRKISEYAPDGKTSETVFAIKGFSPGIQQGVVISTWVKNNKRKGAAQVLYRDDLHNAKAEARRKHLLESLEAEDFDAQYTEATPTRENRFSVKPSEVSSDYRSWAKLTELCAEPPSNGLMEKRGGALISIDRAELERRMRMYFDESVSWENLKALRTGLTKEAAGYEPQKARKKLIAAEQFNSSMLRRYALRPFDTKWCYYSSINPLWNRPRPTLWAQCWNGNRFLLTRMNRAKDPEGSPMLFTVCLSDDHIIAPDAVAIPFQLRASKKEKNPEQHSFLVDSPQPTTTANLSEGARDYLKGLGIADVDKDFETAALIWHHALAIGYAPAYLEENADGIRSDFPRVPLPASLELLCESAALGKQVAALLDTETQVAGVTTGQIRAELRNIANIRRADGAGNLNPQAGDLEINAGWGHRGKGGVVMPGKGRMTTRDYNANETSSFADTENFTDALGAETHDVFLNDVAVWSNIPARVWDYTIGGYQVIKKWLSYREKEILGRGLTTDEVREITATARRIASILLLESKLNENYKRIKYDSFNWTGLTG